MGLFFITVGAGVDVARLAGEPLRILGLTLALFLAKMAVLWPLARIFGLAPRSRILFTLALAQAGEFSFFLLGFAQSSGVLPRADAQELLLVIAMSMVLTPALFRLDAVLTRLLPEGPACAADEIDQTGPVIVAGMGRFGQIVNRMLTGLGHTTVVLDSHLDTVMRMRRLGIRAFYGDIARPDLLVAAGIADAQAIVLAIDDPVKTVEMTAYVRRHYPHVKIIARARDRHHVYQLFAAGTPDSVRELFDSGVRAGKYALAALGYEPDEIEDIAEEFVRQDRRMLADLAVLWRPDIPVEDNDAYLAQARAQAKVIEAALRGRTRRAAKAEKAAGEPEASGSASAAE
jgi:CPA2 family monovalent cation:H+ antiporter-2